MTLRQRRNIAVATFRTERPDGLLRALWRSVCAAVRPTLYDPESWLPQPKRVLRSRPWSGWAWVTAKVHERQRLAVKDVYRRKGRARKARQQA